jgi:hypothetical protein
LLGSVAKCLQHLGVEGDARDYLEIDRLQALVANPELPELLKHELMGRVPGFKASFEHGEEHLQTFMQEQNRFMRMMVA